MRREKLFLTGATKVFVFAFSAAVVILLLCAAGPARANLVTNGDFASTLDGWNTYGSSVAWSSQGNPGGSAELSVPSLAFLSQSVATLSGKTYTVSFDLKGLSGSGAVRVDIGGMGKDYSFASDGVWYSYTFDYAATTTSNTFYYMSVGSPSNASAVLLDNVSVNEKTSSTVPIPGALFLFAPALAGLAAIRRGFAK
jgi:hypothetical protein